MTISLLFLMAIIVVVFTVYTEIERLLVPMEDRVPVRALGWSGWIHTLRHVLVFLGDCAPPGGIRSL